MKLKENILKSMEIVFQKIHPTQPERGAVLLLQLILQYCDNTTLSVINAQIKKYIKSKKKTNANTTETT